MTHPTINEMTIASTKYRTAFIDAREEIKLHLIQTHLSAFVPLEMSELRKQGGPTEWQFEKASELCQFIGTKGDAFLYGGKTGEAGGYMGQLTLALAVMAYVPGGVTLFGLHFEATEEHCEHA